MTEHRTCQQPDRDVPGIKCGYPLPCPWHTATLRLDTTPPRVEIPITAEAAFKNRLRLGKIAVELIPDEEEG